MGPGTLWRPGEVMAEGGDAEETWELTVLLGGVFPDAALRRFLIPNSVESFLPNTFLLDLKMKTCILRISINTHKHTESDIENPHLCIIANRSSVVRALVGDRNTLSSSGLASSLSGDNALSLGVESVNTNQTTSEYTAYTQQLFSMS